MTIIFILLLIIIIIYSVVITGYFISFKKYKSFSVVHDETQHIFISIIIPVRNESENIKLLLNDLLNQSYKKEDFEILLINDHSEDNTVELAQSCNVGNLQIINMKEYELGKKQAIKAGVNSSKGNLIVTIDGDCRVGPDWLPVIASFYDLNKPELIIGPVVYSEENTLFDYMQSLEVAALVASGAGAAIQKKSVMCNGANLAFSRRLFLNSLSQLKSDVASGDDIFLLQAAKANRGNILFLKSVEARVYARPAKKFASFYNQRKRWSSKWVHYKDNDVLLLAFLVFFTNFIICTYFFAGFINLSYFILFFASMAIKSIADVLLLNSFTAFFKKKDIMRYFWLTQLIYPFYIVITAVFSNIGKIEWKKRMY
jgi:cellulose synthase/poly-beta-1,6-N-acetylglucosamine synthase-like glycosyltransferase